MSDDLATVSSSGYDDDYYDYYDGALLGKSAGTSAGILRRSTVSLIFDMKVELSFELLFRKKCIRLVKCELGK